MIKFKYKFPKTALFDPAKTQKLFGTKIKSAMNDILSVARLSIQKEAPKGATSQLINTIGTSQSENKGLVYTGVDYAVVIEKGRKAAPVSQAADQSLTMWMRKSRKGRSYLLKVREIMMKKRRTKPSTAQVIKSALFLLKRSMQKKKREPNPFFDRGINKARPLIRKISQNLLKEIAQGLCV